MLVCVLIAFLCPTVCQCTIDSDCSVAVLRTRWELEKQNNNRCLRAKRCPCIFGGRVRSGKRGRWRCSHLITPSGFIHSNSSFRDGAGICQCTIDSDCSGASPQTRWELEKQKQPVPVEQSDGHASFGGRVHSAKEEDGDAPT
ncbi:hypothetical protein CEXT_496831 [Caerostris extrusa]|uniref:Secreted protein n=1 Tax=Caerostris extrusa TaxID=172846 RepID=A0AAV4RWV8_CAEEX|nr:hypothetical protein CEXT_496831 [Caerostris extrusa]